jgi:anti-anti-sigma regulatory factor
MTLSRDKITGELKISGTLNIDGADSLREALLGCFLGQGGVTVNLSEVDACDTAALQVLLAAQRNAAAVGKPFHVREAPSSVTDTAAALGLTGVLETGKDQLDGV